MAAEIRTVSHWGPVKAEVRDGRLLATRPAESDPEPSPIIDGLSDAVYAENRIREPVIREGWLERGPGPSTGRGGERFVAVPWDTALDRIAGEIERVKRAHGNEAIFAGSYGWGSAGKFHHANFQLYRFFNNYGGFTAKWDSYSFAAGSVIMRRVVGTAEIVMGPQTDWQSIVENARLVVMFGGLPQKNTQVEYGGISKHLSGYWLKRAKDAGIEFVNISLMEDDAPDFLGATWLAPRPNTDTALMLGLAHTLVAEGLHDRAFLDRYCVGFDRFRAYLMGESDGVPKTAAWAATIAHIDADTIKSLARRMASTRTMITMTWSLQRGDHGEQPYWMAVTLAAMLGQIGLPGGGVGFGYGCEAGMGLPRREVPVPSLPLGKNPTRTAIPVARIADMLLNPGGKFTYDGRDLTYPDIHLIYWCGGNPFHHHQDINRLLRAWQKPDTIVVHEPWWTAAARHADIVLPATTAFERNDIAASTHDRSILAMKKAVEPVGAARNDHDIFLALARRLGFAEQFSEGRGEMEWLRHIYEVARQQIAASEVSIPDFETFWAAGAAEIPEPDQPYVIFEDFRRDPARHPLETPSGKIEIYSETIAGFGYDDCPPHPTWIEPKEWLGAAMASRYPLHLLSNQPRTRLHGQIDGSGASRASKIAGREPVWIHPADAAARGIKDGDVVRLYNDRGETLAGAVVTDAVRTGVVQLSTGATYDPMAPGTIGALDKHGNPNMLTLDKGTSKLAQGPTAHSTLVEIERYDGIRPEVTAFTAPPIRRAAGGD
ncbi:MAG: molybdopterin guanine dinucleotide-containing S/N-oxide reductase [Alphaproteobacteria bacterium]